MQRTAIVLLLSLILTSSAALAQNETTTLPMHGIVTAFGICEIPDPCPDPTVNLPIGSNSFLYLLADAYDNIAGVQTAFDFGGNVFTFGLWDCQPNQLSAVTPTSPGGPNQGTIATAFDCLVGGATAVIGRMGFIMVGGCVTQVESSFPFGTHVVSCNADVHPIAPPGRGSVCAGFDGVNACITGPGNLPPFCDGGGPYMGFVGDVISFDGSASVDVDGVIVSYNWDFGDGDTGNGPTPTHVYDADGTYSVTLCVTDDWGATRCCSTTATIDAVIPVAPASWGEIKARFDD